VSTWLQWWIIIGLVTTIAMIAFLVALVRHALLLGRTARRMQEEVAPIARQISSEVDRASTKAASLRPPSIGSQS
jgi:hypothetical protein